MWGKALLGVGAALAALCVALTVLVLLEIKHMGDAGNEMVEVTNGAASIPLNPGEKRAIYAPVANDGRMNCTASGPDGERLDIPTSGNLRMTIKGEDYERIGAFVTTTPGLQTVTCHGHTDGVLVGQEMGGKVGRLVAYVMGAILSFVGGAAAIHAGVRNLKRGRPEPV